MKLLLFHPFHRQPPALDEFVARTLGALARRVRIEQAEVRVLAARRAVARYRAAILLRVPGPDLHASAEDNSVRGAVALALRAIERQIAPRAAAPGRRGPDGLRHPGITGVGTFS